MHDFTRVLVDADVDMVLASNLLGVVFRLSWPACRSRFGVKNRMQDKVGFGATATAAATNAPPAIERKHRFCNSSPKFCFIVWHGMGWYYGHSCLGWGGGSGRA